MLLFLIQLVSLLDLDFIGRNGNLFVISFLDDRILLHFQLLDLLLCVELIYFDSGDFVV